MITVITPPVLEPVSVDEAKDHLRVTHDSEDSYIGALITAARQYVEEVTRRALVTQTLELRQSNFCERIKLRPELQYVVSVKYLDGDQVEQTLTSDYWVAHTDGSYLQRAPTKYWPPVALRDDAVRIRYVGGYPDPGSPTAGVGGVPEAIKQAILMVVGDLFENREAQCDAELYRNRTVDALLAPYRDFQ